MSGASSTRAWVGWEGPSPRLDYPGSVESARRGSETYFDRLATIPKHLTWPVAVWWASRRWHAESPRTRRRDGVSRPSRARRSSCREPVLLDDPAVTLTDQSGPRYSGKVRFAGLFYFLECNSHQIGEGGVPLWSTKQGSKRRVLAKSGSGGRRAGVRFRSVGAGGALCSQAADQARRRARSRWQS